MTDSPIRVLCVLDYYLPGFRGGGPIRTIANMRRLLAADVEIAIFTRDRDLRSDVQYYDIQPDIWTETQNGPIYYASPEMFGMKGLKQALTARHFDLLYLNSYFGFHSSIQVYLWSRRRNRHLPILLAPRGEFSSGALALKRFKKRTYLSLVRRLGLYRDNHWHASTTAEKDDILRQFPSAAVHVAEDPVEVEFDPSPDGRVTSSPSGQLRLAFISRISPMKNLDQLLRVLAKTSRQIQLDIFGPVEGTAYWDLCRSLIAELPPKVAVSYKGALNPEQISPVFAEYDLFALPTHGENFGHVIFEALRAGTPVLISDRTPWKTDPSGAVTAVPLDDTDAWRRQLQTAADRTDGQKEQFRKTALAYAEAYAKASGAGERNLTMFREAAGARR